MHEKPNSISVDEIREQLVNDVQIKPYSSKYKIYIVPEAEKAYCAGTECFVENYRRAAVLCGYYSAYRECVHIAAYGFVQVCGVEYETLCRINR